MGLLDSVRKFGALHQRVRRGELPESELEGYEHARREITRSLLAAQPLEPGQTARSTLRANRATRVEITFHDSVTVEQTLNVSAGGFAVLLENDPLPGQEVKVSLHLSDDGPLTARAHVAYRRRVDGKVRVGFLFVELGAAETERLERFVLDAIVEDLT